MANKPNPANFAPDVPDFPNVPKFLPCYGKFDLTTYIQGASDYEIMCNLVQLYNTMAEGYNNVEKLSTDTQKAYVQLQNFVNTWFDGLDVTDEVSIILHRMVDDGSLEQVVAQTGQVAPATKEFLSTSEGIAQITPPINSSVRQWLDEHPEATTTVQDGAITELKINSMFLPYIKNNYVTPEMFGAKGDGVADDTQAIINALKSSTNILFTGKYKCTSQIDVSGHNVYGYNSILDFSEYSGEHCVVSTSNSTKIHGITIRNGSNISGYGLKLYYIANYGIVEDVQVRDCTNGIYISGAWYNKFSNIFVSCPDGENNACLTFGNEYHGNPANGLVFTNLFLYGGAYGLKFENVTVNSISFDGITIEHQSKCGIKGTGASGNLSFNGIYFEDCALSAEYPLYDIDKIYAIVSNMLIRGKYTNAVNAYNAGNNIVYLGSVYNPSGLSNIPKLTLNAKGSAEAYYIRKTLSDDSELSGLRASKNADESAFTFKVATSVASNLLVKVIAFGRLGSDTTASFCDELTIYIKHRSSTPKAYIKAIHNGARDLSSTYEVSYTFASNAYTVTITNSNGYYAQYAMNMIVDAYAEQGKILNLST